MNETVVSPARTRAARIILAGLAVSALYVGAWALFAPGSWFDTFPGGERSWTAVLGPFNEHLARDVGAFNLMLGALFTWAAVTLDRRLVRAVASTSLLFAVPHTIFHALNRDGLAASDQVAQMVALGLTVVLPLAAIALAAPPRAAMLRKG